MAWDINQMSLTLHSKIQRPNCRGKIYELSPLRMSHTGLTDLELGQERTSGQKDHLQLPEVKQPALSLGKT